MYSDFVHGLLISEYMYSCICVFYIWWEGEISWPSSGYRGSDKITLYSAFEMVHKRLLKVQNKQNVSINLEKRSGGIRYRMYEVNR